MRSLDPAVDDAPEVVAAEWANVILARSNALHRGETQFVAGGQTIDELRTMISNYAVGELKVKLPLLDPAAKIELLEATRYYLEINPELASDFVDRVESALYSIDTQPLRSCSSRDGDDGIATSVASSSAAFRYLVVYEVLNGAPYVLAVAHAQRRPDYWLERKPG